MTDREVMQQVLWMPIETAPLDGTAVLVMRDIWPGTDSGRAEECNGQNTYVAQWWDGDGWVVCYMDQVCDPACQITPTHWMPLPPPPCAVLAEPEPEPVAWLLDEGDGSGKYLTFGKPEHYKGTPLYTAPPARAALKEAK